MHLFGHTDKENKEECVICGAIGKESTINALGNLENEKGRVILLVFQHNYTE